MKRLLIPATTRTTLRKLAITFLCCTALMVSAALGQVDGTPANPSSAPVAASRVAASPAAASPALGPNDHIIGLPADPSTGNCFPFGCAYNGSYQQVYTSNQFSGPMTITQLNFYNTQLNNLATAMNSGTWTISLSTTSANLSTLSPTFSNNIGTDNTQVFSGNLAQSWLFPQTLTIVLTTPFTYNPSRGNLLMTVVAAAGTTAPGGFIFFDTNGAAVVDTIMGRVYCPQSNGSGIDCGSSGTVQSGYGLVTGFTAVVTQETLTVNLLDSGSGTVTDTHNTEAINCSEASGTVTGTCSASYPFGTVVTLTATVGSGSTFAGWGGACAGSEGTTCTVTMNSAQNVTASFVVPFQTVTQTVTTGQQATFSYNGGYASGGNDYIAQLTSGSPVTASVTEISFGTQAACDAIIDTKFPGAHCFVTQNGGGVNADVAVGYELTCPGYPGTNGTCGSDTNPNFLATLGSDFHFQITENTGLGLVGTPPNKTLTYLGGNPLVGLVKYVGPDPLHPCTVNTPPVSASNQIGSFTLDDPGALPVKGNSGGTGSCWLISYGMPGEAPTVTVAAPVNGGIYQLGQNDSTTKANYTCTAVNNGNAATGPYLTVATCSATDTPGGSVVSGDQFDTSTPGPHTFTATVMDSATNTASQTVTYTVQGAQVTLSPTSINFGNVYLFNVSVKAVTLKNTGNATLHINGVSLTFGQPDHSDFGFLSLCPTSLLAGRSCTIFVGFFADEVGTQTATLVITDNAPGSPHQVSMTGTAIKRH